MLSSVASAALRRSSVAAARPTLRAAFFSSGSHDDFAPQRKVVEGEDQALKSIQDHVNNNPVMLYMKGNPSQPMCEWIMMLRFMFKTILQEDLIISYLSLFLCNRRWIFLSGR